MPSELDQALFIASFFVISHNLRAIEAVGIGKWIEWTLQNREMLIDGYETRFQGRHNTMNANETANRVLSVTEAAELLKPSPGTVYHLISERRIPVIKISARCVRFSRTALFLWLDTLTQPADASLVDHYSNRKRLTQ